jgi:hypothetical protein
MLFFKDDGGFTCEVEEYVKAALKAFINHLWEPKWEHTSKGYYG